MRMQTQASILAVAIASCLVAGEAVSAADVIKGYRAEVAVTAETRLDTIFPLANQSPAKPPDGWFAGYDSTRQTYELFVPKNYNPKKPVGVVLFVSPSAKAMGWPHWKEACEKHGVIFAGPHAAGNDCPSPRRVRIVLDVLDELRRNYNVDADRTYIGGFSGGGRIACSIAFALPELFGGVIPICAAGDLRDESWLRQRAIDRLSVAHITGDGDFNLGEVERFRGPILADVGVRSRVKVIPKMGHSVPTGAPLAETLKWLDEGVKDRAAMAKAHPASRMAGDSQATREDQADALLAEGKARLKNDDTLYSGLMQLSGVRIRWPDLPAATEATEILTEYDGRKDHPWERDDVAEQRKFLIARARGLDRYATGPLPDTYAKQKPAMLEGALKLWGEVIQDGHDEKIVEEARTRVVELEDALQKAKN